MTAQQLKNSILQMAVQGKLVPQDPNDEPTSVLIERIRKEKEQLIKEGKIKKEKNPSYIFRGADNTPYEKVGNAEPVSIADEVPFDIPDSWEWVRLSSVNEMFTGNSINETEKKIKYIGLNDGLFYIGTKDVGFDQTINYDNGVRIPYDNLSFRIAPANSILLCVEGGSAGRKIAFTNQDVCFGNKLCCFISYGIDYLFLYYYLQCPLFQAAFKENTTGIIGGVSLNTLKEMFLPVPPLAEQKRIVSAIGSFIPLIREYDEKYAELSELNGRFPELLKKSILQMAVQGKLVPQDENDEPASVLLERVRAEKERLIAAGKIKRDKSESVIFRRDNSHYEKLGLEERCIDDEIPFEIPDSWVWVLLGKVTSVLGGKRIPAGRKLTTEHTGHFYIRVSDMQDSSVNTDNLLYVPTDIYPAISRYTIQKEDVYITVAGTIGRVGKIPRELDGANLTENADRLVFANLDQDWLIYLLQSSLVQGQIAAATTQVGQPKLAIARIEQLVVPLPPLSEQHRIVEAIESLIPIIESM